MNNAFKSPKIYLLGILGFLLLPAQASFAQTHMELKTSVSIREQYDNNIFLQENNERSDYLTKIKPSFNFKLLSKHSELGLKYTPTLVRYIQQDETEMGHRGNLTLKQELSEHLQFDLRDIFVYSDDPLAEEDVTGRVGGDRNTRENYMRNTGNAKLSYIFGPENTMVFGYEDRRLKNDDERQDNGTILKPYASITYNLDIRNQLEIEYGYTKAHFWRDGNGVADDDYYGHDPAITYVYRFTPHTTGALGYMFTTRNFDGAEEDYKVHDGVASFEHYFSPDYSISAGIGHFWRKRSASKDQTGFSYNLSFAKSFERGSINIGGSGGWHESNLLSNLENRGFTEFWSAETVVKYQILHRLNGHARLYYRHDKDENDIEWEKVRGNCGLAWALLPSFSLRLDYDYNDRDDDLVWNNYTDQRVTLTLLYRKTDKW